MTLHPGKALTSVLLFLGATVGIVLFGSIDSLRPSFQTSEGVVVMQMAHIIEAGMYFDVLIWCAKNKQRS